MPATLCRQCAHLPADEREYRQGESDMAEQRRHAEERRRMRDEDEVLGERLERTLSEAREPGAGRSDGGGTPRERDPAQDQGDDDPF